MVGVPSPDILCLAARFEQVERIGADALQHRKAGLPVGLLFLTEQVAVDQRGEPGQEPLAAAHRLHRLEGGAADEDAQTREERLLVPSEQPVAPVDRRTQRLLPYGQVSPAADEEIESLLEPREERLRGEQLRSRGRELDRGKPSSLTHISAIAGAFALVTAKSAFTARARSTKSATASY